jgi:hypothetical protein
VGVMAAEIIVMEERAGYTTKRRAPKGDALPYGCITDIAKDVLHNIRRAALGARAKDFLNYTAVLSFGDAGRARKRGAPDPGLTCRFELAAWAEELGWDKANVLRVRKQLTALNIVSFETGSIPGEGALRWNIEFSTWRALDPEYRRARYARPNAGRKKQSQQEPTVVILNTGGGQSGVVSLIQNEGDGVVSLNTEKESKRQRGGIKLTKGASSKPTAGRARGDPLISNNNSSYGREETATNVTARSADRAVVLSAKNNQNDNADAPPLQASVEPSTPSSAPPPSPAASTRAARPRKLSDAELEAHNREAQYVRLLIEALRKQLGVKSIPNEGREKQAAHWFYAEGASMEAVLAFYAAMKATPYWHGKFLSLAHVQAPFAEHKGDAASYQVAEARSSSPRLRAASLSESDYSKFQRL